MSDCWIFLRRLRGVVDSEALRSFCLSCGDVRDIKLMNGYAFVGFRRAEEAERAARSLDGRLFGRGRVVVGLCQLRRNAKSTCTFHEHHELPKEETKSRAETGVEPSTSASAVSGDSTPVHRIRGCRCPALARSPLIYNKYFLESNAPRRLSPRYPGHQSRPALTKVRTFKYECHPYLLNLASPTHRRQEQQRPPVVLRRSTASASATPRTTGGHVQLHAPSMFHAYAVPYQTVFRPAWYQE